MNPLPFERPAWEPVPHAGCRNVDHRVLDLRADVALVLLRFALDGTIHQHSAPHAIDVYCIEGRGFIQCGTDVHPFASGERLTWPAGVQHRLWTEGSAMTALIVEHIVRRDPA